MALTAAIALAGCSDIMTPCQSQVYQAAQVSSSEDTAQDLDGAFEACTSLEEFERAVADFPAALDDVVPAQFATMRCGTEPALASTSLCRDLLPP